MALPGITDELELKRLLRKLLDDPGLSYSFAVVARRLKDGDLSLSKKQKLKRKEVVAAAEEMAREEMEREDAARGDVKQRGKKPPKSDVLVGTCRLLKLGSTKLFLQVQGKKAYRRFWAGCVIPRHLLTACRTSVLSRLLVLPSQCSPNSKNAWTLPP